MLRSAAIATLGLLIALTLGPGALASPATGAVVTESTGTAAGYQPWGRTRAPDQVLRRGCRSYRYHYRVSPPSNDWTAEVFLLGPGGRRLTHAVFYPDSDPAAATRYWRICRASTVPGRHKMRMRVTWWDGYDEHVGWVQPSYFRLYRPR